MNFSLLKFSTYFMQNYRKFYSLILTFHSIICKQYSALCIRVCKFLKDLSKIFISLNSAHIFPFQHFISSIFSLQCIVNFWMNLFFPLVCHRYRHDDKPNIKA